MSDTSSQGNRKRVKVDDVQIGMYCGDVYNDDGAFILSAHIPISNLEQIAILKRLGVKTVEIDLSKGKNVTAEAPAAAVKAPEKPSVVETAPDAAIAAFEEELPKAKDVYRKTMDSARNALQAIRLGKSISTREIEETVTGIVESVFRNPDALVGISQVRGYDDYIFEHSVNVAILSCALCHSMRFDRATILEAGIGAFLHDIGMTWIPERIVNKPEKLTDGEFEIMRKHPEYGIEILKDRKGISDLARVVIAQHHERLNGTGYPKGIKGNQVHVLGLIAGITDVYDAMTSDRVHRQALTPQHALANLYGGIDTSFSRPITENFVRLLGVYPVGSFVRLISGELAVVIRIRKEKILYPDVLVLFAADGKKLVMPIEYQLSHMVKQSGGERFMVDKSVDPRPYGIKISDYVKEKLSL